MKKMKRFKKLASIVMAAAMVMTTALPAFAADNHSHKITVQQNKSDAAKHTYQAYQIFKGDLSINSAYNDKDAQSTPYYLSNIDWGNGIDSKKSDVVIGKDAEGNDITGDLLQALQAESTFVSQNGAMSETNPNLFAGCKNAADVAAVLGGEYFKSSTIDTKTLTDKVATIFSWYLTDTKTESQPAAGDVQITVPSSGYYLIKDSAIESSNNNYANTRFLLEVVGDSTVTVKSDVPHGDKQIYKVVNGEIVSADANYGTIGSHVAYVISSQVPNYTGYDHYYFVMNDRLDKGLTFDGKDSISVNVISTNGTDKWSLIQGSDYHVYTQKDNTETDKPAGNYTFRLAFADIMQYPIGSKIEVTYTATVNGEAVVGVSGNANTWNLQYSNNPNNSGGPKPENPDKNPGLPDDEEKYPFGQTPDEKTLTYLTEIDITKYAEKVASGNELEGAEFTLTGTSYQVVLKDTEYYVENSNGTFYMLTDGTYTEEEPTDVGYVEIGVGTDKTEKGYISYNNAGEVAYKVPDNKSQYNGQTLYQRVKGTSTNYADVNTKYEKKTGTKKEVIEVNVNIQHITPENGKIIFKGLGAGTYTLTETVTPKGYNTLKPIIFTIVCNTPDKVTDGKETCTWTVETVTNSPTQIEFTEGREGDKGTGIFSADIINKKGSLLPSTGGIGTTIFYIIGGILVLGAAILLITKKRMSREA